jgi:hypothetical protein
MLGVWFEVSLLGNASTNFPPGVSGSEILSANNIFPKIMFYLKTQYFSGNLKHYPGKIGFLGKAIIDIFTRSFKVKKDVHIISE